jgi:hypothetical protein
LPAESDEEKFRIEDDPTAGDHRAFAIGALLIVLGAGVAAVLICDPERSATQGVDSPDRASSS